MKITFLENDALVPPAHFERVCLNLGHTVDVIRLHQGRDLPSVEDVQAVVALGGAMGAYEGNRYPYLIDEAAFLASAVSRGVPVMGVCLGCQLLAQALGGSVFRADVPEADCTTLEVLEEYAPESVLSSRPTLILHQDAWTLPAGARLTARTDRFNAAFRLGSALGVQNHPEVTVGVVREWFSDPGAARLVAGAGRDTDSLLDELTTLEAGLSDTADLFFGAWLVEAERADG